MEKMHRIGVGGFGFWERPSDRRELAAEYVAESFGGKVIYEYHQDGCDSYEYATWIAVPASAAAAAEAAYGELLLEKELIKKTERAALAAGLVIKRADYIHSSDLYKEIDAAFATLVPLRKGTRRGYFALSLHQFDRNTGSCSTLDVRSPTGDYDVAPKLPNGVIFISTSRGDPLAHVLRDEEDASRRENRSCR